MNVDRQKTILIVDADAVAARSASDALAARGYATLFASSGEEALGLLESAGRIDLALVDPRLESGMGGVDAARILQERRPMPVILVSSDVDGSALAGMELVKAYGFVQKGSGNAALLASVAIAFQRHEAEKTAREDCLRRMLAAIPDIISINDPGAVYTL